MTQATLLDVQPVRRIPWPTVVCELYEQRMGRGSSGGAIIGALKPLVKVHGPDRVTAVFRFYCQTESDEYFGAQAFRRRWALWERRHDEAGGERISLSDRSRRNLEMIRGARGQR